LSTAHELTRRWLDTARADLKAAGNCIDGPHYLPEIAAYHCQQAAEKLVKAVLIYRGIEPARIHDIDALVGRLSPVDPIRPVLEPLGRFTPYAVAFRYPGEDLDPSPPERDDITGWIAEIETAIGAALAGTASN
jgi:HEPN domain-containing protein